MAATKVQSSRPLRHGAATGLPERLAFYTSMLEQTWAPRVVALDRSGIGLPSCGHSHVAACAIMEVSVSLCWGDQNMFWFVSLSCFKYVGVVSK